MLVCQARGVTDEFGCSDEGPANGFYPDPSPAGLIPEAGFIPGGSGYGAVPWVLGLVLVFVLFSRWHHGTWSRSRPLKVSLPASLGIVFSFVLFTLCRLLEEFAVAPSGPGFG